MVSNRGFGVPLSPVQRAICRSMDGVPLGDLWQDPDVRAAFGGTLPPEKSPFEFWFIAAIRCAKSLMAAARALQISQTCDVSKIRHGEPPRIPVVSVNKDQAKAVFGHLTGTMESRDLLRPLIEGVPTKDTVLIRHPDSTPRRKIVVEVMITPMSRAGASLAARWLAGVIFDEAPLMLGNEEGVMNLDDARARVLGRILPGGQILYIGSPWAAQGPAYEAHKRYFGDPSDDTVVVQAPGWVLHPAYWTPERCEKLKKKNIGAWTTDCAAQFSDGEQVMFKLAAVERNTRKEPGNIPAVVDSKGETRDYVAAMDPATRGNAWTLVVLTCTGFNPQNSKLRYQVVVAHQWIGNTADPRRPREVFAEMADILKPYAVNMVHTDQFAVDALKDTAEDSGLSLMETNIASDNRFAMVDTLRVTLEEDCIELPNDRTLRGDLSRTKRRVVPGGVKIIFPRTKDGRHCDYVPSLALALKYPPAPPKFAEKQKDPFEELLAAEEKQRLEMELGQESCELLAGSSCPDL